MHTLVLHISASCLNWNPSLYLGVLLYWCTSHSTGCTRQVAQTAHECSHQPAQQTQIDRSRENFPVVKTQISKQIQRRLLSVLKTLTNVAASQHSHVQTSHQNIPTARDCWQSMLLINGDCTQQCVCKAAGLLDMSRNAMLLLSNAVFCCIQGAFLNPSWYLSYMCTTP